MEFTGSGIGPQPPRRRGRSLTALSIVAGRVVPIQSPARNRPGTAVWLPGARGAPGATEKVRAASRGRRERAAPGLARRRQRVAERSRGRDSISASLDCAGSPSAALATSDRLVSARPRSRRCRTPTATAVPAGRRTAPPGTAPVEPQVRPRRSGTAAVAAAACQTRLEGWDGAHGNSRSSACHSTAQITARAANGSPIDLHGDSVAARRPAAPGLRPDQRRRALRETRAPAARTARRAAPVAGPATPRHGAFEHAVQHLGERRRGRHVYRLVQRREGQRLPQHLDQPRRLAKARQPGRDRLGGERPATRRETAAAEEPVANRQRRPSP